LGSERWGSRAPHCSSRHWLGRGQRCCVSRARRVECCAPSSCLGWCAAGQRECGCELRRAERELRRDVQCCEQRGCERQCVWARDGRERAECCWSCRRERLRSERVAERQRACVPDCWGIRAGAECAGVCGCAAGQRECGCELRRAERELRRGEQLCDVWLRVRHCCGPRGVLAWRERRSAHRRHCCVVDGLDEREQRCGALRWGRRRWRRCVGVCECAGWPCDACCEL